MIKILFRKLKDASFTEIQEYKTGSWIHITATKEEDIKKISDITTLSYDDLVDTMDEFEVPRIERQKDNLLLFTRVPSQRANEIHTDTLTIVITPDYFVTLSLKDTFFIPSILNAEMDVATTQKSKLLLAILLKMAFLYTKKIKAVRAQVLSVKKDVNNISDKEIIKLTENEEILSQYLNALVPLRNVIETLLRGEYIKIYEEDSQLLNDLLISIKQSVDVCTVSLKSIQNLRDSYQIIFTNYVNRELKLLTTITIMLTIPTIIFSFYGMNIVLPFDSHPLAAVIVGTIVIFVSFVIYTFFRYKKWF